MRYIFPILLASLAMFSLNLNAMPSLEITNGRETLILDRAELEAFPQMSFSTVSPYFNDEVEFSGPNIERVLEHFGVTNESVVTLVALNDYEVSLTIDELNSLNAIIAIRRNSKLMSVRDRGPFWLMLPLTDRPDLNTEAHHRYMIWQLNEIKLH